MPEKIKTGTGIDQLDSILDGLYIGDNVVWYDDAGSLASVFFMNFLRISMAQNKPLIYVSFDRSPKNLLDKLGSLAENQSLIILDCFTYGKGEGSDVFKKFYNERDPELPCKIMSVKKPARVDHVMDAFYGVHETLEGDVRFVFESLTGMQELWGGEEHIIKFYAHSCPRLYDLNTIAYWILEKGAHSQRLKAKINQIAQVAIDLSIKKGTTSLTILKAEKRDLENLNKPHNFWTKGLEVNFDSEKRVSGKVNLGTRLKSLRVKHGISQSELAKLIGVTPSTISQVEGNLIYPSLPALLKMAEVLSVEVNSFFQEKGAETKRVVFPAKEAIGIKFNNLPEESIRGELLTPVDFDPKAEPYLIEIQPKQSLPIHFFIHKGEEMGYMLSGHLQMKLEKSTHDLYKGDVVYLSSELPSYWKNPDQETARLLWIKIK
ncbi:helix-turn-helix domain-containing protein [Thermodesulfobacteriota bacterium]